MPPLRERDDDVVEIAEHMLALAAEEEGKSFTRLTEDVKAVFRAYDWPGNVRQLQNVIRNVAVMHDGDTVTVDMLPPPLDRVAVPRAFKAVG
jgi:DNA-binding NtrC family response regulator